MKNPLGFFTNPKTVNSLKTNWDPPLSPISSPLPPASFCTTGFFSQNINLAPQGGWAKLMATVLPAGGMSHSASRGACPPKLVSLSSASQQGLVKHTWTDVLHYSLTQRTKAIIKSLHKIFCSLHLASLTPVSFFFLLYIIYSQWTCYLDEKVKVDRLQWNNTLSSRPKF